MKSIKFTALVLAATSIASAAMAEMKVYKIDTGHSGVSFKIRHFVSKVPGGFTAFSGEIGFDEENPDQSYTKAVIEAKSIDTRNGRRDNHLRTEDYFNVEQYPQITFSSTKWEAAGKNKYKVTGDLTMMGQTHPVTLDVEYLGSTESRGNEIVGWVGSATIDRTQWGMSSNTMLGDEVEIELNIEANRSLSKD